MSNFEYLKKESKYNDFVDACIEAEKIMSVSYSAAATYSRKALEQAVKWVYANDGELKIPFNENLDTLISYSDFRDLIDRNMYVALSYIRKLGNKAVHTNKIVRKEEAVLSLRNLFSFTSWIDYCYSDNYEERSFDENILGKNENTKKSQQEKAELEAVLNQKEKTIEDLIKELNSLREENENIRKQNQKERVYNFDKISEYETRKRYIDLNIELSNWEIGNDCLEEVMVKNMPTDSGIGYADYVLYGSNGKPLAVIEAKKTGVSPKQGKEQARLYADALERQYGVRPVIFFSNGIQYYIWDDMESPEREINGIYSKKDLEKLFFKKNNRQPLKSTLIRDVITNRSYQKMAIKSVFEVFEKGHRKALLVMATGSGKTRTAASIVDVMTRTGWAKNILFLADRTELVRQAKESFKQFLPSLSLCNLTEEKASSQSRMIFSTYPTMMNAIDNTKNEDGTVMFTIGHFDLIILDESHRSIYKKYKAIFDYFDASLIGLTATPKNEIDKNTYRIFDLADTNPTYAYELDRAVEDGYLVPYARPVEITTELTEKGIRYDELSEKEKQRYEEAFDEGDKEEIISGEKINRVLFNIDTVDLVINELMTKGIRIEGGDKLGKTIIFAVNQHHAEFIVERFNALYPEYKGKFAAAVHNKVRFVSNVIDNFKTRNSYPQIVVSVDMLDTGIDVPEIVNLVFFKKVRSKAKFWQMVGRGTRLCKDLFGKGMDKKNFLIFDCYGNFDFFRVNEEGEIPAVSISLTEKIFGLKVDIVSILGHLEYQKEERYVSYRNKLVNEMISEISAINTKRFDARTKIHLIERYTDISGYEKLDNLSKNNLKEVIAPLIVSKDNDEFAKRFDSLAYTIELALLEKANPKRLIDRMTAIGEKLSKMGSITKIRENKEIIQKIQDRDYWSSANIFECEKVRENLRELIKLIESDMKEPVYIDFKDEIIIKNAGLDGGTVSEEPADFLRINNLENYRERVEHYLKDLKDNSIIEKLKNNEILAVSDIKYLQFLLWEKLGTREEYEKVYGNNCGDNSASFLKLISSIIGLDKKAVEREFSKFLNSEDLNSNQMEFVRQIVDYIAKNGSISKTKFQEFPFNKNGGIIKTFEEKKHILTDIISIVDTINTRFEIYTEKIG